MPIILLILFFSGGLAQPTTTTIAMTPQVVTVSSNTTATVSVTGGLLAPVGTVALVQDGSNIPSTTNSFNLGYLTEGRHTITATFTSKQTKTVAIQ